MKIFKYPLAVSEYQSIQMPRGAQVLSLQVQGRGPQMWALVEENQPLTDRGFITVGTGHVVPSHAGRFVGTYQIQGGALVFHVFEEA
jgi:hypothetical protein